MAHKTLFTGKTQTVGGSNGAARSADGFIDFTLPEAHPAAENLFGVAWSACFMGAIGVAAQQRKIKLPETPSVDAQIDLNHAGGANFFLAAKLDVSIPGIDRAVAQELVEAAHEICPYSKATRGNVETEVNLV